MFFLKDSEGKKSASFTMMYATFLVCLLWLLVSIVNVPHIRPFDVASATGFLSPLLALYFSRKWTQTKQNGEVSTIEAGANASTSTPPPAV